MEKKIDILMQAPFEQMGIPDRKFFIWHLYQPLTTFVCVFELNQGELVRLVSIGEKIDPLPWPDRRNSPLILRRWDMPIVRTKGYALINMIRSAERLRAALELGYEIKPSWERKLKDGRRKSSSKGRQGALAHDS